MNFVPAHKQISPNFNDNKNKPKKKINVRWSFIDYTIPQGVFHKIALSSKVQLGLFPRRKIGSTTCAI